MADLNSALQSAISTIPECLAAGYVDLSSGMLLGIKSVDSHPAEVVELLAAATAHPALTNAAARVWATLPAPTNPIRSGWGSGCIDFLARVTATGGRHGPETGSGLRRQQTIRIYPRVESRSPIRAAIRPVLALG